jgi:hypothetical protein
MKKSLIALAVAAALPVAAQADVTLSGSVGVEYTLGSSLSADTSTAFSAASSEVLANGMTATASFDVLGGDAQGNVSLSGDFGSLTGGSSAATLEDSNEDDQDLSGVAYTGSFAGMSVHATAGTWNHDGDDGTTAVAEYAKYGASYDLNGLVLGASNTDGENEVTASYAFGDLTVSASNSDTSNSVVTAAYAATMGDLAVSVSAASDDTWDLAATYTMGDVAITAEDDEAAGGATLSAAYTSGAMSLSVDSDSVVEIAYDMGNADLGMTRDGDGTTVSYTVSF